MANEHTVFEGPKCLIGAEGTELRINHDTLQELSTIDKTLNIVTIVGLYRTGKSYLLTRLAGKDEGFAVGNNTEAMTKGIWAWCVPHPIKKDQQLLLLDTEGLGDVMKGNKTYDNKVFTMAALLSSTLVYNIKGAFDADALQKLSDVLELAKNIKTSEHKADADGGQLDVYLPEFLLVLRDFCLEIKINGKGATPKEYLEHCLSTVSVSGKGADAFNEARLRLRKYFKRRNCFPIVSPASGRNLMKLESLRREELDKDFLGDLKKFLDYVFEKTQPFQTSDGHGINGRMFTTLMEAYVDAISKGAIPCIDTTMQAMVEKENLYIVNVAVEEYNKAMRTLKLPTVTEAEFVEVHKTANDAAHQIYLDMCVMDKEYKAQNSLTMMISGTYSKTKEANEKHSKEGCLEKIKELHEPIAERYRRGKYYVASGFSEYEFDIEQMLQSYNASKGIGFMKDQVKSSFLQQIEEEKKDILDKDKLIKKEEKARKLAEDAKKKEEEAKQMALLAKRKADEEMKRLQKESEEKFEKLQQKAQNDLKIAVERGQEIIRMKDAEIERLSKEGNEREHKRALEDLGRRNQVQAGNMSWLSKAASTVFECIKTEKNANLEQDKLIKTEARVRQLAEVALKKENEVKRMAELAQEMAERKRKQLQREKEDESKLLQQKSEEDMRRARERADDNVRMKEQEIERLKMMFDDKAIYRIPAEPNMERSNECVIL